MGWWLWALLLGFGIIAAVTVAQMVSGDWLGNAVKKGFDSWERY